MRRVFVIVDLALLRGEHRTTHLDHLACTLARTWTAYHQADISFGYRIIDFNTGELVLDGYLQRIASALKLPKRLHSHTGTDLSGDDLEHFISLISSATDEEQLSALKIRFRRNSRCGNVPAAHLHEALHKELGHSYLQGLAPTDSTSGVNEAEGVLLLFTPGLADDASAKLFLGTESLDTTDNLHNALLQHLKPDMWAACAARSLRVCWLTAEDTAAAASNQPLFHSITEALQQHCPASSVLPLSTAADAMDRRAFLALMGLPQEDEAAASQATAKDEVWPESGSGIGGLKHAAAALSGPYAGCATAEGKRKLRAASRHAVKRAAPAMADKSAGDAAGPRGRGLLALKKAQGAGNKAVGAAVAAVPAPAVGTAEMAAAPAEPLSLEDAIQKITNGVAELADGLVNGEKGPAPPTAGPKACEVVQSLVAAAFNGVLALEAQSEEGTCMEPSDVRIALLARATVPAAQLKAEHQACKSQGQAAFAWRCAAQILLRLSISAQGAPAAAKLQPQVYSDMEALLQLVVATMRPIPSGGQRFFSDVIKPGFGGVFATDVRRLEAALWDDDEDEFDPDGMLAVLRAKQASMEVSGETPGTTANRVASASDDMAEAAPWQEDRVELQAPVAAVPPQHAQQLRRAAPQPAGGSLGGSQSVWSGAGSGVNVSSSAATAATARRMMPTTEFVGRRFNNSRQYQLQVRAAPAPTARAKQLAAAAAAGAVDQRPRPQQHAGARPPKLDVVPPTRVPQRAQQVPDTPQSAAPGAQQAAVERHPLSPRVFSPAGASGDNVPNTVSPVRRPGEKATAGKLRQPVFDVEHAAPAVPGAILSAEHDNAAQEAGADAPGAFGNGVPAAKVAPTWFNAAVVPNNKVKVAALAPAAAAQEEEDEPAAEARPEAEAAALEPEEKVEGGQTRLVDKVRAALGCGKCKSKTHGCIMCRPAAKLILDEAGAADIAAMIGCKNKHCKGPKTGCASCWKEAFARLEELPAEPAEPVAEQEVAVPEEEAKPVAPESVQPRRATRSSKRKADATQAEPPQAATTEAPAKAAGGDVKGSKRTRSAAKGETVAEPAQAEAPEGPPVKRQSSRLNKAAHPDAAPEPKPTSVARPKKGSKNAVAPEPQAAAGVGPAAEPGTQAPTAPPPPTAPSVPAEAEDIFQQIIQAEVTLQAGDALDLGMDPAAVLSPAPAPAPHPPLAEAESTPVPAAMEVTPVAVAPPASLLGKRSAPPTGRATMTKRGRLAGMLASKGRVRSLLRSGPLPSSHLPSKSPRCIEDVSSPAKPSPYAGDWDLPAEPAPEKPAPAKAPTDKAKGKKRRGAAAAPPSPQRSAGGGRADSSTGDAPEPTPLPRLGGLSPVMHDPALSDDEDAAVLNAAATGGLSPPGAPPALESPCKPTKQAKQVAAHASVLEASSEEHASGEAATPQSHLKAPKNQQHQQLRMSKLVPTAAQKKIEGVPAVGDEVLYAVNLLGSLMQIHCRVTAVLEANEVSGGGWECTLETAPVGEGMGAVAALTLKPSSATERPAGTTLDAPGLWTRLTTASPVPNTHPAIPAAETERHNAAVRLHRRDSEDSVPVLPETAERRRQLQQQQKPGTGAGDSPRHHLRPCTLDYHEAAVLSAERLRMPQRRNSLTPSFDGALQVRRAGKDVTTPVSFGVSALTKENVLGAKVSPAAGNLAAAILGGLYQGGTPLPPDSVQNYLAGDIWGLASPRA